MEGLIFGISRYMLYDWARGLSRGSSDSVSLSWYRAPSVCTIPNYYVKFNLQFSKWILTIIVDLFPVNDEGKSNDRCIALSEYPFIVRCLHGELREQLRLFCHLVKR